jgi:hypothetical protein
MGRLEGDRNRTTVVTPCSRFAAYWIAVAVFDWELRGHTRNETEDGTTGTN